MIEFRPEHSEGLLALYRRNFGAWSTERFVKRRDWQCGAGNPWRSMRPTSGLVAIDNGGIVGGMVLYPIPWRVDGERLIVLCGGEFAIDARYRMLALPELVSSMFSRPPVTANGLHPAVRTVGIGLGGHLLPMSRAHFALQLRNRGRMCRAVRRRLPKMMRPLVTPATIGRLVASKPVEAVLQRFAHSDGPPRGRSIPSGALAADVRPIQRFGDDYGVLWDQARRAFRMTLDKDADYMNWRYLDCPTFQHPIVRGLYREGKLSGVVVAGACTALDEDGRPCGANGEILELITAGASAQEIEALLVCVCRELDQAGVDKIGASTNENVVREVLQRIDFHPEEDRRLDYMVLFDQPDPERAGHVESTEGVYITAGDGDALNALLT